jgi:D-alanyl-D-alanine dipeptidase
LPCGETFMRFKYLNAATSFLIAGIAVSFLFAQTVTLPGSNIKEAELVELTTLDKSIKLDIRYARSDNFVGRPVYDEARAFLQRPAADALIRVHKKLKKQGLGLVIFDGYRPWSVTKLFWEVTPEDKRKFVANPRNGSRHNRGAAVDLSIYDLKSGKALEMPSDFDDFSEKAHPEYKGGTAEQTKNRDLLKGLMEAEGFTVNANEWWHYDYKDWQSYGLYDIPFSTIGGQTERIEKAKIKEDKKLKAFFEEAGVTGGIYIYDLRKNRYTIYDRKRMDTAFSPASTSKIVHSLIFLDTGAVKDENEVLKWDGVKRSHEPANQDHTLRSAYKVSALWFFHDVSKRLTRQTMQRYYDGANYANRSTEGYGDTYWVKGNPGDHAAAADRVSSQTLRKPFTVQTANARQGKRHYDRRKRRWLRHPRKNRMVQCL